VTADERLLVLMTLAAPTGAELAEARALAPDRDRFAALAELNATVPLVHRNLERAGLPVPAAFAARTEEVRAANEARLRVARELFARFADRGIPVVILKGVLFAETIYRDPHYKRMNDVDILVRRGDRDAVYAVYDEMRFWCAAQLMGGSAKKQEKHSHHAPPFFSRDLTCMVGTHWGLITPLSPYTFDYDGIWSRVADVDFYGHPAKSMSPEDNLHHLCVHLPYYKTGLRELADIYNLVRHAPIDWEVFEREVRKAGTENLVYHALSLANALVPCADLSRIEPRVSRWYRRDAARKTADVGRLLRSRCTHLSVIEKHFADFRATKSWGSFLRMWGNMLWPPSADVAKMSSTGRATLAARLAAPGRIRRVFYRDVGRLFFWIIMAKCAWDVVKSTFTRGAESDPSAFAAGLGVTVADLRRLKEALE